MESATATPAVTAPRFRGQSFTLGGKEYLVPPLSMRAVVDLKPELARIADADADSPLTHLEAIARVILSALQRNYPELTYDDLGDLLDMGNIVELLNAVTGHRIPSLAADAA
jgi:hypothetical protein